MTPEERHNVSKAAEDYYRWARFFGEIPPCRSGKDAVRARCNRINIERDTIREQGGHPDASDA